jgi:L-lactate dehydrogenase complex protein LldG
MSSAREAFLQRVRQAVADGNRAGGAPALPPRGDLGYQGAGPDPAAHFGQELAAAGGVAHLVPDRGAAVGKVVELVRARPARRVLLGRGRVLDALALADALRQAGVEVTRVEELPVGDCREPLFAADVGIAEPDYLIAETGTLAVSARPDEPRSLTLLPPVHIAVADHAHLLPDLFDLFVRYPDGLPSCLTLITGPSKTGDIELRLVTGVHGPGEVHVVLLPA